MKKALSKPPARAYAPGQNPASIAKRIGRGGKPPPRPDPGPAPPEDPEWKLMYQPLRDMMWVLNNDDRWDNTWQRKQLRKWLNEKPLQFLKRLEKWTRQWERTQYGR